MGARMEKDRAVGFQLLAETVGLRITIESNDYDEAPGFGDEVVSSQKIVFRVEEEEPDLWVFGILFLLACLSFADAKPRGISDIGYDPAADWSLGDFVRRLELRSGALGFSSDYIGGRCVKTAITYQPGGRVTLETRNRAKSADHWVLQLQGRQHLRLVDSDEDE
jgi:hypothetical protein